ncbi:hypothetical protein [Microvirga guangxiensis]|uniref:Uncharacterized protein n=1 Tax=Microvirga guangxiensis TaxID=549386 RepID=A0A1G5F060_9HYPH|nr:hypothetical protein [Microvirga guangxiensis]SCY32491.1 hypothetical protein SAMN02927923_01164 [Microvirga guangxiensis]
MNVMEALYIVFVGLAGISMGSLIVLMIGHLMNEHWLAPIRAEVEAAALTLPLFILLGVPLAFGIDQLFPWVSERADLPPVRATFLSPGFFLLRSAIYLLVCAGMAFWLIRTRHVRQVSAVGLALLTPIVSFAAYDWVLSREPHWWSSLFGFAFGLAQVLAALAGAILVNFLKPDPASSQRMKSLERALLTLALLTVWTWFAQFIIAWLANLPQGAGWFLRRADASDQWLLKTSYLLMLGAIVVLVPSGVSRAAMIGGSSLVLLYHGAHTLWILQPRGISSWLDIVLILGIICLWIAAFITLMKVRPSYAEEASAEP